MEKKIACASADYIITQLGYDVKKFRELKRYMDERGLKTPVFGNVYVLGAKAAEKFTKAEPPGCWASRELADLVAKESKAADKGLRRTTGAGGENGRVSSAAGLDAFAEERIQGASDHQADHIRWIIRRSEAIADKWEEYAEELTYAPKGGFYFYESPRVPKPRGLWVRVADLAEPANWPKPLIATMRPILRWIDKRPSTAQAMESAEMAFKKPVFGCHACGNCVLGLMEYVCPMTCPKNLRNGPCGGTDNGRCEVIPEQACIWVSVYERAQAANRVG